MENIMNDHKFTGRPSSERMTLGERWARFKRRAPLYRRALREWGRIHGRRITHQFHNVVAGNRAAGPVTFLACSGALAVALTMTTLYTPAYSVTLDGESVGVVADAEVVQQAMETVEATGTSLLGHDYQIEGNLEYEFALTLRSDLTSEEDIQNYFYGKLDSVSGELRQYQVVVDGQAVGAVKDEDGLNRLLEELKAKYTSENTVSVEFMDTVTIEPVYEAENLMTLSEMRTALQANQGGSTTYTVVAGDTFYGIAYANDMSMSDLEALNPGIDINRLMVGDVLNVKELTPVLSVQTVEEVTYTQSIPCPVEEVEDSSMYVGETRTITQGVGPGGGQRHRHLCERPGDRADGELHHHPPGAHHHRQGGGHQGEAPHRLLGQLSVAHLRADHLLLRRPVYLRKLQLPLRHRHLRLLWGGGVRRRRRHGDLRRLPGQLWQPGGHHPRQRDPDLLRP